MTRKDKGPRFAAGASNSDFDGAEAKRIAKFALDAMTSGKTGFVIDIEHHAFDNDRQFFKSHPWRQYHVRPFNSAELEAISISVNAVPPTDAKFTILAHKHGELCSLWVCHVDVPRDTDCQIATFLRSKNVVLEPRL